MGFAFCFAIQPNLLDYAAWRPGLLRGVNGMVLRMEASI